MDGHLGASTMAYVGVCGHMRLTTTGLVKTPDPRDDPLIFAHFDPYPISHERIGAAAVY